MVMSLSKLRKLVMDREAWHVQSMGLQRVGHDWVTKLNWTEFLASLRYRVNSLLTYQPSEGLTSVTQLWWRGRGAWVFHHLCLLLPLSSLPKSSMFHEYLIEVFLTMLWCNYYSATEPWSMSKWVLEYSRITKFSIRQRVIKDHLSFFLLLNLSHVPSRVEREEKRPMDLTVSFLSFSTSSLFLFFPTGIQKGMCGLPTLPLHVCVCVCVCFPLW